MSRELLEHLRRRYAFDATPGAHDLGVYHVPFDDLLGDVRVETRLARGVQAGERVALLGGSGSGKSSVIAGVLGAGAPGVAPILVPLMASAPELLAEPGHVVDRILDTTLRAARAAEEFNRDEARDVRHAAIGHQSVERVRASSVQMAVTWLRPGLAREIRELSETRRSPAIEDRLDIVTDVLGLFARHALQPVIVFDDTDRWLTERLRDAIPAFFGPTLRTINELPASLVVSVNREYQHRRRLLAHLDTVVEVPDLSSVEQLKELLDRRVAANVAGTELEGATAADAFEDRAVAALFAYYRKRGVHLRQVIQLAHRALAECVDQGEGVVSEWFVQGSLPDR